MNLNTRSTPQAIRTEMMTPRKLPNELLLCIAKYLVQSSDILSFALASRVTWNLLMPVLYNFNIQERDSSALLWAIQHDDIRLAEGLASNDRCNVNTVHNGNTPLIYAASKGSTSIVRILLASRHIRVNFCNKYNQSALWWAASGGWEDVVRILLERDDIDVNVADLKCKETPLGRAAAEGHSEVLRSLLAVDRINVNRQDFRGYTPIFHALFRAITTGDQHGLDMLLAKGIADLSHQDANGFTMLMHAVRHKKKALTELLLCHSPSSIELRDVERRTALWHAVKTRNPDIIQLLLTNGSDVCTQDVYGESPLHRSIRGGKPFVTDLLLRSLVGRRPTFDSAPKALPPLCLAARGGKSETVQLLLDYGWDVNELDSEGRAPIHFATDYGHHEVVRVLLNNPQLDVNARDSHGATALHNAAYQGHLEVVDLIMNNANVDINIEDENGCTPLWCATRHSHWNVALRLLDETKTNVNAVGIFNRDVPSKSTSLHHAVSEESGQVVQRLLAVTALNPNIMNHLGQTPLSYAAHEGKLQIVEYLLSRQDVRVNAVDKHEQPPLWSAASRGHVHVVQRLLQCQHINVNQGWGTYLSPLLAAITGNHPDVAIQLLGCGTRVNVNARTYPGESALCLAAAKGQLDVVKHLLRDSRIDCNSTDYYGRTALWWAAREGRAEIVQALLEDGRVQVHLEDRDGIDALRVARSHRQPFWR